MVFDCAEVAWVVPTLFWLWRVSHWPASRDVFAKRRLALGASKVISSSVNRAFA